MVSPHSGLPLFHPSIHTWEYFWTFFYFLFFSSGSCIALPVQNQYHDVTLLGPYKSPELQNRPVFCPPQLLINAGVSVHADASQTALRRSRCMCTPVGALRLSEDGLFGEGLAEPGRARLDGPRGGGAWRRVLSPEAAVLCQAAGWRLMRCQDSLPRWLSSNTGWSVSLPTLTPPHRPLSSVCSHMLRHTLHSSFSPRLFLSRLQCTFPQLRSTPASVGPILTARNHGCTPQPGRFDAVLPLELVLVWWKKSSDPDYR